MWGSQTATTVGGSPCPFLLKYYNIFSEILLNNFGSLIFFLHCSSDFLFYCISLLCAVLEAFVIGHMDSQGITQDHQDGTCTTNDGSPAGACCKQGRQVSQLDKVDMSKFELY